MLLQGMAIMESLYFGLRCADSLIRQCCDIDLQKKPLLKILEEVLKKMTHMQGCTTCGSLAAWLQENGEIMRK